jgi:hypothetical protein
MACGLADFFRQSFLFNNHTRILRHPISKGKAHEGKNCHYWEKRSYLSRFSIIL